MANTVHGKKGDITFQEQVIVAKDWKSVITLVATVKADKKPEPNVRIFFYLGKQFLIGDTTDADGVAEGALGEFSPGSYTFTARIHEDDGDLERTHRVTIKGLLRADPDFCAFNVIARDNGVAFDISVTGNKRACPGVNGHIAFTRGYDKHGDVLENIPFTTGDNGLARVPGRGLMRYRGSLAGFVRVPGLAEQIQPFYVPPLKKRAARMISNLLFLLMVLWWFGNTWVFGVGPLPALEEVKSAPVKPVETTRERIIKDALRGNLELQKRVLAEEQKRRNLQKEIQDIVAVPESRKIGIQLGEGVRSWSWWANGWGFVLVTSTWFILRIRAFFAWINERAWRDRMSGSAREDGQGKAGEKGKNAFFADVSKLDWINTLFNLWDEVRHFSRRRSS